MARSGALAWASCALSLHSPDELNRIVDKLLKEYSLDLWSQVFENAAYAEENLLLGAAKLICKYRPQISQYFCSNLISLKSVSGPMVADLGELKEPLSLLERIALRQQVVSNSTENSPSVIEDANDVDFDNDRLESNAVGDFLVSGPPFWNLTDAIRRDMYCEHKAKMIHISRTAMQGISHIKPGYCVHCKELDTESTESLPSTRMMPFNHRLHYCIKFELDCKPLEFLASQYSNRIPEISRIVAVTGSAFYAYATTCSEYLSRTWPRIGPFFLSSFQDAVTSATMCGAEKAWHVYSESSIACC
jgi:hypothetical protein